MKNYLEDVLTELIREAQLIKSIDNKSDFEMGRLTGYYEIISVMLNQIEAFNLTNQISNKITDFNAEELI
tara:strand:+ start:120 stop:329 length:210 start_codon:yes stop_codon:yes gene_type:complete